MSADELRDAFLTSGLTDQQRAELWAVSEEVTFQPGDITFVEGEPADFLWILLAGEVELSRHSGPEQIVVATMTNPGQWAGGLRAWTPADIGAGYRGTGRALSTARFVRVPSDELGRLVSEWFPFGKHIITGIYQTITAIEATVRQRESLIALGTLSAGLAHELNNPASAAVRAVSALRTSGDTILSSLTELGHKSIEAHQFVALDGLRVEALGTEPADTGALAAADREDAIGRWLSGRDVDDAWRLASELASTGVDVDWCRRVESAVGSAALAPAVRWVASTLSAGSLIDEIQDATTRISHLVESVKSYSQMDRASLQRCAVTDGIESTLVMLSNKLRDVTIERDFGDVPEVEVYAGELNQVWTNLIDNAIDAMDGKGTLSIATTVDGDDLVVDVTDTGHGMSPDVQARVFEPFFTTKDVGKGTGLGLDIARRIIVDRHHGTIAFSSSAAGTTASVRLPLHRGA